MLEGISKEGEVVVRGGLKGRGEIGERVNNGEGGLCRREMAG